jgi:hypothetical protein
MNPIRIVLQNKPSTFKRSFSFLLFLIFFFYFNNAQGQSLSIYSGPSVPFGFYGSNNITLKESGFAKTGYHVGFMLEDQRKVRILNTFFQFSYNQNGVEGEVIKNFLLINDPRTKDAFITSPWSQFVFLPGLKANWFKNGYDLYAKAGVGFGLFRSFSQMRYLDSSLFVLTEKSTSSGLLLNAGLGINISLTNHIAVCTGMELLYANPNYGRIVFTDGNGNKIDLSDNDEIIPFQTIQWHLGLRFNLGKK